MTNRVFLDSNILIYLYSEDEIIKKSKVENLLNTYEEIFISTQVLFEFTHITYKKVKLSYDIIENALEEFNKAFRVSIIKYSTLQNSIRIAKKYKYSFVDSLILSSSIENGCDILFSEDMHAEQLIENSLKIINPFN